jgi:hypothetical protein
MEKSEIKAVQAKLMKLKKGGFFVYFLDKSDKDSDSKGHNLVISKKVAEVMLAFKSNKKKDSKIARGSFFFDAASSKFLFELAAGDSGRIQKGLKVLAGQGAPILKQIVFPTPEELKVAKEAAKEAPEAPSTTPPTTTESTVPPTPMSAEEAALLTKLVSGETLTDEEALLVLGLDIEQEIMDEFDQAGLDEFLSPDMSAEADLSHQEAFSKFKSDWIATKSTFDTAVRSIFGDIKVQAQEQKSLLKPDTPEATRAEIETALAQARSNREKLKKASLGPSAALEQALDKAGDVSEAGARSTVETELKKLLAFISDDPLLALLRTYPGVSISGTIRSSRMTLEKIQIQVTMISKEIVATGVV